MKRFFFTNSSKTGLGLAKSVLNSFHGEDFIISYGCGENTHST